MVRHQQDYINLKRKLEKSYDITTQEGSILNYLNLQIIQSQAGISFDQTAHILDMLQPHFPLHSSFTKTDTPFRTDREYE